MKFIKYINILKPLLLSILFLIASNQAWATDDYVVYYHNDALGSPVAATNEQGSVIWKEHYHPYGEKAINDQQSLNEDLGYTGKSFDRTTGLSYYGARYYDPVIGRFMGIDPVGFDEGNIHSFNRYAYANNNPLLFVDPDGRSAILRDSFSKLMHGSTGGGGFGGGFGGVPRSVSKVKPLPAAVNKGMNTSFRRAKMTDGNGNIMPSAKSTTREKYRRLADQAIAKTKTNANPTVTRNGKDIFRVHKPGTGHGDKVTQNVMNGPIGNKTFPGTRDVNVRASHNRKLQKALNGKGGYSLRLKNGKSVR